jgi:nuclear pore complex protein Nup210
MVSVDCTENRLDILEAARKADRGPDRLQASPIVISNGRNIRLAAASIHVNGRFFANSSSLRLKWEATGCEGLAYFEETKSVEMLDESAWERSLVLQNSTGVVSIVYIISCIVLNFGFFNYSSKNECNSYFPTSQTV